MKVAIIMGSDSDWTVMKSAFGTLADFGVEGEVHILSAHRTPEAAADFAREAEKKDIEVIIAAAGMAAHLAGAMAAQSVLPIIGVPIKSGAMNGFDALLSTVMMPPGVPVATVGIDGGKNAALLAVQMLSIKYPALRKAMRQYKENMKTAIREKDEKLAGDIMKSKN